MPDTFTATVKDSAGNFYLVRDAGDGLGHCFVGVPAKRPYITADGRVICEPKAKARERLVRRIGCVILAGGA